MSICLPDFWPSFFQDFEKVVIKAQGEFVPVNIIFYGLKQYLVKTRGYIPGAIAGKQIEKHNSQRVYVGMEIKVIAGGLFRRHEGQFARYAVAVLYEIGSPGYTEVG